MATSYNKIGLEISDKIEDYPHITIVDNKHASGYAYDMNMSQFKVFVQFKQSCIEKNLIPNFD